MIACVTSLCRTFLVDSSSNHVRVTLLSRYTRDYGVKQNCPYLAWITFRLVMYHQPMSSRKRRQVQSGKLSSPAKSCKVEVVGMLLTFQVSFSLLEIKTEGGREGIKVER